MERKRVFARERETEREIVQVCVGFEVNFCLLNLEIFFDCESDSLREREIERERERERERWQLCNHEIEKFCT